MIVDTNPKILVVDDDPSIRNLVHRFLERKYEVDSAADGNSALAVFDKFQPRLVILDWNLPDTTGYHLCQEMQRRTNVFVVMLSSRTDASDRLKVLSAGADDYICKPFCLEELEVRIEVLLRRMKSVNPSRMVFDRLAIDTASQEVTLNDRKVKLTTLEFNILHLLASHPGEAWSRQQLIQKIWGWKCNNPAEEQVVSVHIGHIRKKLIRVDAAGSQWIKTVRNFGYRFERPSLAVNS